MIAPFLHMHTRPAFSSERRARLQLHFTGIVLIAKSSIKNTQNNKTKKEW